MLNHLAPWLYQGDQYAAQEALDAGIALGGIIRVSDLHHKEPPLTPPALPPPSLWCGFDDNGETLTRGRLILIDTFMQCLVHWRQGPLLVHCREGRNRSVVIAALLLRSCGPMQEEAIVHLLREKVPTQCAYPPLIAKVKTLTHYDFQRLAQ